jgi:putative transposase
MDRLPKSMHAQVRRVLRQAWELDNAGKAETLLRNLARHFEKGLGGRFRLDPGRVRQDASP